MLLITLVAAAFGLWRWHEANLASAPPVPTEFAPATFNDAPPPSSPPVNPPPPARSTERVAPPPAAPPPRVVPAPPPVVARSTEPPAAVYPKAPDTGLELQVALARRGFSPGPIDGVPGGQTAAALRAFQEAHALPPTGQADAATREHLTLTTPALAPVEFTAADLARLQPLSPTWLGKSRQTALDYETALELLAERTRAHPALLRSLNPGTDWDRVPAGTRVLAPAVPAPAITGPAAHLHIRLADRVLQVRDPAGRLIAHFPVSIARHADKRPAGELRVTVVVPDPNYTFNPALFPDSPEAIEAPERRLILPPGPNNPVGVAWIGIDLPGYGIHGTPQPEQIGRTESLGCFRLANWDARTLLRLAWTGLPVLVDP